MALPRGQRGKKVLRSRVCHCHQIPLCFLPALISSLLPTQKHFRLYKSTSSPFMSRMKQNKQWQNQCTNLKYQFECVGHFCTYSSYFETLNIYYHYCHYYLLETQGGSQEKNYSPFLPGRRNSFFYLQKRDSFKLCHYWPCSCISFLHFHNRDNMMIAFVHGFARNREDGMYQEANIKLASTHIQNPLCISTT